MTLLHLFLKLITATLILPERISRSTSKSEAFNVWINFPCTDLYAQKQTKLDNFWK